MTSGSEVTAVHRRLQPNATLLFQTAGVVPDDFDYVMMSHS